MPLKQVLIVLFLSTSLWAQSLARMGWPESLTELYQYTQHTKKNYVLLISRLPSIVVDFRSNQGVKNSLNTLNFQKDYHPGHEMIGWTCNIHDLNYTSLIGFTGESNNQHQLLLDSGWGLTALLATFKDGYIQTPMDLQGRLEYFNQELEKNPMGPMYLMATLFEITNSDCESLINEVYNYTTHENDPATNFGLLVSPGKYEGAGCGSFAIHFLEKIFSFRNLTSLFQRQLKIPYYLLAQGTELPDFVEIPEEIKKIGLHKPLSKFKLIASDWSESSRKNLLLTFIDPELILLWQKHFFYDYFKNSALKKTSPFDFSFFRKKVKRGFWQIEENYLESNQKQSKYIEVDKDFDMKTRIVSDHANQFSREKKLSLFKFFNFPGIIVENK